MKATPVRFALAMLIIGIAVGAAVWIATYRASVPFESGTIGRPPVHIYRPAWTTPGAALIGIAAVGAALFVLRRR